MTSAQAVALSAVIVVGIAVALLIWRARQSHRTPVAVARPATSPATGTRPSVDFPPVPKWKPTVPVDIERTIATFAHYTDRKKLFVVFEHGTCVVVPEASQDPEAEAKQLLDRVYNFHPDFDPRQMDDGNFSVSYFQPAYSVVFSDEFKANREYIDANHLDGVVRDEVLLNAAGRPNTFDDRGKIGLFGRARMFMDAQSPNVVRVWRPPGA
jgi:hypothetical protein